MPYTWIDAVKDFLGAVGAILIALPWLLDFRLRGRQEAAEELATAGALSNLKSDIQASLKRKIDTPKVRDLVFTLLGLLCVCASFVIALLHGMLAG
ncbi:MAG: hypothetical protein JOZ16_13990 [Methylobacteriaceae bacterium]|nr:hypothetical protein [Methylobacteriaceae bacterium]